MKNGNYISKALEKERILYKKSIVFDLEDRNLFGYLVPKAKIQQLTNERVKGLLDNRKLPLVLDLDDTLVRSVGADKKKYVLSEDIEKGFYVYLLFISE